MIPHVTSSFGAAHSRRARVPALSGAVGLVVGLVAGMASVAPAAVVAEQKGDDAIDRVIGKLPDPLLGTPPIAAEQTGKDADQVLATMLKPRSDSWADWNAPLEPLHRCGEPRALPPCVPPPPCHPSLPPAPFDLVGVRGTPSCGPIYDGPCAPRTGTHDHCPHPHAHRLSDRFFDLFYLWK